MVVLLIRHGTHELGSDIIAGRAPGVHLSPQGRIESTALSRELRGSPIRAIYSSPLDRTRETAEILGETCRLPVSFADELLELNFGDWTGRSLDELWPQEEWQKFNAFRSGTRIPNGELMCEVQTRAVRFLLALKDRHDGEMVAVVSHGDVIKAVIAYFLGISLDHFRRVEIETASVSAIRLDNWGPTIFWVNRTIRVPGAALLTR